MSANELYKAVAVEYDLGKEDPAMATMNKWKKNDEWYFGIRFYWTNDQGELKPGKNGITVQAGQAIKLMNALINTYNEATGGKYVLATRSQLTQEALDDLEGKAGLE